jgi:hypothetical protein
MSWQAVMVTADFYNCDRWQQCLFFGCTCFGSGGGGMAKSALFVVLDFKLCDFVYVFHTIQPYS